MEWMVVHFVDDDAVEAVPSAWVFEDTCYWPPYKTSKLMKAISLCTPPICGEWNVCKIRKLANGKTYQNLQKAKEKSAQAECTSDINSDIEVAKRKIKQKRFFDENDFEDFSPLHNNITPHHKISVTRKKQKSNKGPNDHNDYTNEEIVQLRAKSLTTACIESEEDTHDNNYDDNIDSLSESSIGSTMLSKAVLPSSPSTLGARSLLPIVKNKSSTESTIIKKNIDQENREPSGTITCALDKFLFTTIKASDNLSDENFKKQVLRQLQIINLRQQQMSEDLGVLLTKANSGKNDVIVADEISIFNTYNLPLSQTEDLERLEHFLSDKYNFDNFVKEIVQIGGMSYKHMIKRVLPRIMTDDITKLYSWIGFKGKLNFSTLKTCSAILIATQKVHNCSEATIEAAIKYWLVKSNERQSKQAKKDKKS